MVRFGISVPNFGDLANPGVLVDLAVRAEPAGWDGFFVWDHIVIGDGVAVGDPWVQLSAIAQATERILLGPMVTPLPRRRPWVVARQAATLDHLSGGRLILGVGIGYPPETEFATFGEPTGDRVRADMLDEGLSILNGMWSGSAFSHTGDHYTVAETRFAPKPMQQPRIPIWVAAEWPNRRPLRRAARFDGAFPVKMDLSDWTPDEVAALTTMMRADRGDVSGFEIVVGGSFEAGRALADSYGEAGATWYLASPDPDGTTDDLMATVAEGPGVS